MCALSYLSFSCLCLSLHLFHGFLSGSTDWRNRSGVCGQCHICVSPVSACLFNCCTVFLAEGVGLLSLVSIISVCRLFLLVSSSVAWLSTCISWLKESGCCLSFVSYLFFVCFCLSLYLLHGLPVSPGWRSRSALWLVSYLSVVCFCLSLHLLDVS